MLLGRKGPLPLGPQFRPMTRVPESIFSPDSPQGQAISHLFVVSLVVFAVIFAAVAGLVAFGIIRFRAREGGAEASQTAGNKKVEIAWTAIPVAIVAFLFIINLRAMDESDPPARGKPDLLVVGHQWWWEVRDLHTGMITANEVHIPIGRPVSVQLDTADVLHEFWVPRLTRKMMTVPLAGNRIWLEAEHAGIYQGACSEFCGTQHAWMRFEVVAQTPADFAAWEQAQERMPPSPSGQAAAGWSVMKTMTCINCHTIRGTEAVGRAGPDLTHFASRRQIGAGVLENNPANLRRWLSDPQAVKPGAKMPQFTLSPGQVNSLVAYLETLK